MRNAVIASTARTGIGRAFKGALNHTKSPTLMGHVLRHAVDRAGIDPARIDDVVAGTVLASGTAGMNLARNAALAAGFPVTVSGLTLDRQCASGLMAVATAAKQVIVDGMDVIAVHEAAVEAVERARQGGGRGRVCPSGAALAHTSSRRPSHVQRSKPAGA
jgi:acetyl-CoA acetyltransferase